MGKEKDPGWSERYRARKAAGLCTLCGAVRAGEGITATLCAECADRQRRHNRAYHERRRESVLARRAERRSLGVCTSCGGPRDAASRQAGKAFCAGCRAYQREWWVKERKKTDWGAAREGRPLPFGGAVPRFGAVGSVTLSLDPEAHGALRELLRHELKGQERAAEFRHQIRQGALPPSQRRKRELFEGVELEFRVSRVVRESIRRFADKPAPPRRFRPFWTDGEELARRMMAAGVYEAMREEAKEGGLAAKIAFGNVPPPRTRMRLLNPEARITVALDAECLRIVERDANELYRGNRSEAVRAILCAANGQAKEGGWL